MSDAEDVGSNEDEPTCLICGKSVPEGSLIPLCEEHGAAIAAQQVPEEFPRPGCIICGQELPDQWEMPYCAAHYLEYQSRQTLGVSTSELDDLWSDRLI